VRGGVYYISIISLILVGCAKKAELSQEQSAMIVWKSPTIRYADMGFISDNGNLLKIEIYQSGSAIMRLTISNSSICMGKFQCLSKKSFNRSQLSPNYPDRILENIFRGRAIFRGLNIERARDGFKQSIYSEGRYDITYTVLDNRITFRDRANKILIKVKKL